MIYLDYAASAPIRESALRILDESLRLDYANSSAAHTLGKKISKKVENCRDFFLKTIGGEKHYDLIFTSSASESNNTIIKGIRLNRGNKILLCGGDHPSLVIPAKKLEEFGVIVEKIPLNKDSTINQENFLAQIEDQVKLVLLSQVNSQSGVFNNCDILAKAIKEKSKNIHIHLDASQGFGKFELNLDNGFYDSVSISAHKIGGPKGIGGLFIRKNIKINPLIEGGDQELGVRSSTVAASLILGFKEAFSECLDNRQEKFFQTKVKYERLRKRLKEAIPSILFPFGDPSNSGPYILVLAVPKISSDILLRHLEEQNIFVASSSACSSKIKGENPTFKELGLPSELNKNILRVSFDDRVSMEDLSVLIDKIEKIYLDLRHLI